MRRSVLLSAICGGILMAGFTLVVEAKHPGYGEVGLLPYLAGAIPYIITHSLGIDHAPRNAFLSSAAFDLLVNASFGALSFACIGAIWRFMKGGHEK